MPSRMMGGLAVKRTTKESQEVIRAMRVGSYAAAKEGI
jgi:hypothetical protein